MLPTRGKSSGEYASGSTTESMVPSPPGSAEATHFKLQLDSAYMDASSIGSSIVAAAKVALGAVLLAGDAVVANISGDNENAPAPKQRAGKKRRMKRKKGFRTTSSEPPQEPRR